MLANQFGRPFDDFDALKMHVYARSKVPEGEGYCVITAKGRPVCGYVPNEVQPKHMFTNLEFEHAVLNSSSGGF